MRTDLKIPEDILLRRLHNQGLEGQGFLIPQEAVKWFSAIQSQDYNGALWAVCQRTSNLTLESFNAAFAAGEILRTHVLRPTWHFVCPEDIRWMLELSDARLSKAYAYNNRRYGLDEKVLTKTNKLIVRALEGGKQLTRKKLAAILHNAGIDTSNGVRLAHIICHAEQKALICSGSLKGKEHSYALLSERVPDRERLSREEALALLARRYFTSHGPATIQDYVWWSGLTMAEASAGFQMVQERFESIAHEGRKYWFDPSVPVSGSKRTSIHLLPNYDEYIVAYKERQFIFGTLKLSKLDSRQNPLFNHIIIRNGRIAGTWKRITKGKQVKIETNLFHDLPKNEQAMLSQIIYDYGRYMSVVQGP